VGGWLTGHFLTEAEKVRGQQAFDLDAAKRRDDRLLGRDTFQRDQLLALQNAVDSLSRYMNRVYYHDLGAFRAGKPWGSTLVDDAVSDGEQAAKGAISTLRSRLANDALRTMCEELLLLNGELVVVKDQAKAEKMLETTLVKAEDIRVLAGKEILRTFVEPNSHSPG
jgi:hypothetical protein